eukprot:scaffold5128_cov104-Isochrysis_galbana.AAC.3
MSGHAGIESPEVHLALRCPRETGPDAVSFPAALLGQCCGGAASMQGESAHLGGPREGSESGILCVGLHSPDLLVPCGDEIDKARDGEGHKEHLLLLADEGWRMEGGQGRWDGGGRGGEGGRALGHTGVGQGRGVGGVAYGGARRRVAQRMARAARAHAGHMDSGTTGHPVAQEAAGRRTSVSSSHDAPCSVSAMREPVTKPEHEVTHVGIVDQLARVGPVCADDALHHVEHDRPVLERLTSAHRGSGGWGGGVGERGF